MTGMMGDGAGGITAVVPCASMEVLLVQVVLVRRMSLFTPQSIEAQSMHVASSALYDVDCCM
jgi:hypothetical protein